MLGNHNDDIEEMLKQIAGNEREVEKVKMIFTMVSSQILSALLAVEYKIGFENHVAEGGDPSVAFTFNATRAYGTAKQMAVNHMQQIGYGIGIKPKTKIQE